MLLGDDDDEERANVHLHRLWAISGNVGEAQPMLPVRPTGMLSVTLVSEFLLKFVLMLSHRLIFYCLLVVM